MINQFRLFRHCLLVFFLLFSSTVNANYYSLDDNPPPYYNSENQTIADTAPTLPQNNIVLLREMLAAYSEAAQHPWIPIPDDAKFRPGRKNLYVPLLRERLVLTKDLAFSDNSPRYDKELIKAVKNFQERHGLEADGVIGKNTRAALNVSPQERVKQILINIDRWADLSTKLTHRYLMVNIPDYQLYVVDEDQKVLTMKVIIGRPTRPTPDVTSKITRLVFKPYWNVPITLAQKDIATKAMEDPDYLDKNNIRVYRDDNYKKEVSVYNVNWDEVKYDPTTRYRFRQQPGESNSLGLVKFEFPNRFDVYLHDTPAKNLFSSDKRAFSSGCIRLEKPFALVEYLMRDKENWTEFKIDELLSDDKPAYVNVPKPLPIVITYLTAWIDEGGRINFRDDIYGRDGIRFVDPEVEEANNPPPHH